MEAPKALEVAHYEVSETLHLRPEHFGFTESRWSLARLREAIAWMRPLSLSAIWQILDRLDIAYKRGRRSVHSPDPNYPIKAARIRVAWQQVQADPVRFVLLYQDELTYYRCPTLERDYAPVGLDAPLAHQGTGYNTSRRIAGCLDAHSGRLICWQRKAFNRKTFIKYLLAVEACYPDAQEIFLVLDNWPVHWHEDVRQALSASRITLLFLPTYAPWLNPIEKVWRKLKQEVLHMHRHSMQWQVLQERVSAWLSQYEQVSPACKDLLHYVGLLLD